MVDRDRSLERHTGNDAKLKWDSGDGMVEIDVTDVSWDRDHTMEEVQHNGSLNPTLTVTELRYSGSFDYEGQNPDALADLVVTQGSAREKQPTRGTLTIREYEHDSEEKNVVYTFRRVQISNISRDYPADGVSSTSVDWEAEDMDIERF